MGFNFYSTEIPNRAYMVLFSLFARVLIILPTRFEVLFLVEYFYTIVDVNKKHRQKETDSKCWICLKARKTDVILFFLLL